MAHTLFMFPTYPPTFFLHTIVRFESSLLGMVVGGHWQSDLMATLSLKPPVWAFYVNTSINTTFVALYLGILYYNEKELVLENWKININ